MHTHSLLNFAVLLSHYSQTASSWLTGPGCAGARRRLPVLLQMHTGICHGLNVRLSDFSHSDPCWLAWPAPFAFSGM